MRKTLVAGNWKLNGSKESIQDLLNGILAGMSEAKTDVAVCAPYIYIPLVEEILTGTDIAYGSESIS